MPIENESGISLEPILRHIMEKVEIDKKTLHGLIDSEPLNFERQDKVMAEFRAGLVSLEMLQGGNRASKPTQRVPGPALRPVAPERQDRATTLRIQPRPGDAQEPRGDADRQGRGPDLAQLERDLQLTETTEHSQAS